MAISELRLPCPHGHHHTPFSQYVREVLRKADVTKSVFLVSLIYCFRANKQVTQNNPCVGQQGTSANIEFRCSHCLFLGCVLLASKYCDDEVFTNRNWAAWGAVSLKALNQLEIAVIRTLQFDLYVDTSTFQKWASWYTDTSKRPGCDYSVSQQLILVVLNLNVLSNQIADAARGLDSLLLTPPPENSSWSYEYVDVDVTRDKQPVQDDSVTCTWTQQSLFCRSSPPTCIVAQESVPIAKLWSSTTDGLCSTTSATPSPTGGKWPWMQRHRNGADRYRPTAGGTGLGDAGTVAPRARAAHHPYGVPNMRVTTTQPIQMAALTRAYA